MNEFEKLCREAVEAEAQDGVITTHATTLLLKVKKLINAPKEGQQYKNKTSFHSVVIRALANNGGVIIFNRACYDDGEKLLTLPTTEFLDTHIRL